MSDNSIMNSRVITTGKPIFPSRVQKRNEVRTGHPGFEGILKEAVEKNNTVKFSKHAEERLRSRNININEAQIQKINDAVSKAQEKGVKESLVLMDNLALVVSIKNKTVITAVNNEELKENVFTNIDGAVIV